MYSVLWNITWTEWIRSNQWNRWFGRFDLSVNNLSATLNDRVLNPMKVHTELSTEQYGQYCRVEMSLRIIRSNERIINHCYLLSALQKLFFFSNADGARNDKLFTAEINTQQRKKCTRMDVAASINIPEIFIVVQRILHHWRDACHWLAWMKSIVLLTNGFGLSAVTCAL